MNVPKNERRDWSLVVFIIPLGILLIIFVGQLAISIFPNWSVNADMRSNLDPSVPEEPASLLQPLLPQIMTPMAWAENYLDQGSDFTFPSFFVFEPTATASSSPTTVSPSPTTPSPTATTPSPTYTSTPNPTDDDNNPTATTPTTCQDPAATNYGGPLPCTYPPTTCQDPLATNYGGPLPCTYPPTGYPSTMEPSYTQVPPPSQVGSTPGPPDNSAANIYEGTYFVLNYSIEVGVTPDANYDLILYEYYNSGSVYLDWVIVGISNFADGSNYYEVFNWGNGSPDDNTNVGDIAGSEDDEQEIDLGSTNELYDPDDPDGSNNNETGILIDVDTATSEPPPGVYDYIVVIAPEPDPSGSTEVNSIDVTEVPISP